MQRGGEEVPMKLGLGLYRHMLTAENYRFARQCGCTHVIAHLVDYFDQGEDNDRENQPTGSRGGWGRAGDPNRLWAVEELVELGSLDADNVHTPGIYVNAIFQGAQYEKRIERRTTRRA